MKKVLAILALLSMTCGATEILSEYYVMEKVLPLLTEAQSYTVNGHTPLQECLPCGWE